MATQNGGAAAPNSSRNPGSAASAAPRSAPSDDGSVDSAARGILGLLDGGNAARPRGEKSGKRREAPSELDDAALASLRAEDPGDDDDEGHEQSDDDDVAHQRDDDAPNDEDEGDPDSRDDDEPADDSDPDAEDEDDDPRLLKARVKVKVNGKVLAITVGEAIKGYQRHGDYSRGTAANAEKSTQLDSHLASTLQQRQALDGLLVHYAQQIDYAYGQEPNWDELYRQNPLEFVRQQAAWTKRNQELGGLMQLRAQNAQIARAHVEHRVAATVRAEAEKLFERRPEWKDPVKGKAARERLVKYAGTYGYKPEELQITDGRHLEILDKAEKYDALMERARKRELADRRAAARDDDAGDDTPPARVIRPARPGPAPRPVRPSERNRKEFVAAKTRAARTGRTEDAAAAIARII
jgi:hypothetical protein